MGKAKDLILRPISSKDANAFVRSVHYSGKVATNSQLHIGIFYQGKLEGALQFGPSLDKRKLTGLVEGTEWNEFIELNRMVLTDELPRNSESRAIAVSMRLLRKYAPHLKWAVSFADATQCGDGTIYRASGFVLTGIKKNSDLWKLSTGEVVHSQSLKMIHFPDQRGQFDRIAPSFMQVTKGKVSPSAFLKEKGIEWEVLPGYQLRYIYFLDKSARQRLTVPEIPFSEIWKAGAGMYRGERYEQQRADEVYDGA